MTTLRTFPTITDLRIYAYRNVSKEHGRKRLHELQKQGLIQPEVTPTGRRLLSYDDAERLAEAL